KKIIIYYVLVIVIPCCLLGILAFRGIKNDHALIEREQRKQLTETGAVLISETHSAITTINNKFRGKIPDLVPSFPSYLTFEENILKSFANKNNLLKSFFLIQPSGSIRIFHPSLLYLPEIYEEKEEVQSPYKYVNMFTQGWKYEYQEKNLQKALTYYKNRFREFKNKETKAYILIQIARVHTKLSEYNKALETYRLIESEYGEIIIDKRIHLGIMAQLEKIDLNKLAGDTTLSLNNTIKFLNRILNTEWQIDPSGYNNLLSSVQNISNQFKQTNNKSLIALSARVDTLYEKIKIREKTTEYLLEFAEDYSLLINDSLIYRDIEGQLPYIRYAVTDNNSYYFSLFSGTKSQYWGIIYNCEELINNVLLPLIKEHSENENFQWQLVDESGKTVAESLSINFEMEPVIIESPGEMPVWTLKLYSEPSGIINTLFLSGHSTFLFIFIFIVLVLALGLFFTIQIVGKELQLSKMKSDFISTVSHEFKSPLTSIRHITDMLVFKRVPTESKKQEYYEIIQQQSERLSHLIENILDFSKLEEGRKKFRFEPVNMDLILKEIIVSFKKSIPDKNFKLTYEQANILPVVHADKEAISQVIHNLLDNAFKYSGKSDLIEVQTKSDKKSVFISIKDYGIGIPSEDNDKIYNRFYRVSDDQNHLVKGSGIGLTIVKQIVNYHGGTISHESQIGSGSTFIIRLPILK
ncbi:HAMP domain-containing histidine kinase, partial [Candidatus Bathyarchaeota archaeon]|nr:HAMP domain-containing histidine kinase [Candidatus Bathyarchaeota archaeon]